MVDRSRRVVPVAAGGPAPVPFRLTRADGPVVPAAASRRVGVELDAGGSHSVDVGLR